MRIWSLLVVILTSLALTGCGSKAWDWFSNDDEEEIIVYEEDEEFPEEEFIEEGEAFAEGDEYEYEYEYEYEDEGADRLEPPAREPRRQEPGEMRGASRYGDEPEYERPESQPARQQQPTGRTPGRTAIYFDYKKDTVPASGLNLLQLHAQFLKVNSGVVVTVEGHTDSVGSYGYNKRLGMKRAEQVADLLMDMGVSASQIVTVSYGEERPAKSDGGENSESLNRRVELVY